MLLGGLYTFNWGVHVIHAPGRDWGACISCGRDACAGAGMSCLGRLHALKCLLWPAVLAIGPLCISEAFICMSYDWDIIVIVHMHRSPIMFKVQVIASVRWTESTLERRHAFVVGAAAP